MTHLELGLAMTDAPTQEYTQQLPAAIPGGRFRRPSAATSVMAFGPPEEQP